MNGDKVYEFYFFPTFTVCSTLIYKIVINTVIYVFNTAEAEVGMNLEAQNKV